jgi:hypothetical protein
MSTAKKGFVGGFCGCFGVLAAVVVLIIIVAVIIGVASSGGGNKKAEVVSTPVAGQAGKAGQSQPIGTTQKVGDAEVTVHGVRESRGGEFLKPDPGNKWVIVDVSARNVGSDPYALSSMLQTAVRDSSGRNYNLAIGADTQGSFDGTMPVGGTIRGEVAFEVPVNAPGLVFIFEQAFGTTQAFWTLQ